MNKARIKRLERVLRPPSKWPPVLLISQGPTGYETSEGVTLSASDITEADTSGSVVIVLAPEDWKL